MSTEPDTHDEQQDRGRPNVSGDLPTLFRAAPMFRRSVVGYDRFQVDTYVQWAEDELSTADREREHLEARHVSTCAALEEARQLLARSPGGSEFLQVSRRIGAMLATAADEAESLRADAQADRAAASAEAERVVTEAGATADWLIADGSARARTMTARAARVVARADRILGEARTEAEARLAQVCLTEQRAAERAAALVQQALEETAAARRQARQEIVAMLGTGREQRRRADAEAAANRERLDRDAATRRTVLLAEVAALEHRRTALQAELDLLAAQRAAPNGRRLDVHLRRLVDRLRWRSGSLRAP